MTERGVTEHGATPTAAMAGPVEGAAAGEAPVSRGPSVPLPSFRAPAAASSDPEAAKLFVFQLTAWHRACGQQRPLREYLPLAMADRVSQKWAFDLLETEPGISDDTIKDRFLARFAAEVRKPATAARDKLHTGRVTQKPGQDVVDYYGTFMDVIRDIPNMTEEEKIRWFQSGLLPSLRATCACDHTGREFATLDACVQFAYGEERKLKITGSMGRARPAAGTVRPRTQETESDEPAPKRARIEGPEPAAAAAGPSARGESRGPSGRGGGRGRGRGGHTGGRSGGRAGPTSRADEPDPHKTLSHIRDTTGRLLTVSEVRHFMRNKYCLNCFKKGHFSRECRSPQKPVPDDPRP